MQREYEKIGEDEETPRATPEGLEESSLQFTRPDFDLQEYRLTRGDLQFFRRSIVGLVLVVVLIGGLVIIGVPSFGNRLGELMKIPGATFRNTEVTSVFPIQYTPYYSNLPPEPLILSPSWVIKNISVLMPQCYNCGIDDIYTCTVNGVAFLYNYDINFCFDSNQITITKSSPNSPKTCETNLIINGEGRYVTPGLIDMHSHLGVSIFPQDARADENVNESPSDPSNPQVRVIDAINPDDPAIVQVIQGGVTAALILPGSANVFGGEGIFIKLGSNTVTHMFDNQQKYVRAIKMACGENPPKNYSPLNKSPNTRLGVGWQIRKMFYSAASYLASKNQCNETNGSCTVNSSHFPLDLQLEQLVAVLNSSAILMVHCYKKEDMEMMIRTSHEFNFKIGAFHHAVEAYKIADILAEENIPVAIWADHWGFKMESYEGTLNASTVLKNNNVCTIVKTDHPVLYGKYLMYEVAKLRYWNNLAKEEALKMVTNNPTQALGLKYCGISVTKEPVDIVVWDRDPFEVGAMPTTVIINSQIVHNIERPVVQSSTYTPAILSPSNCDIHQLQKGYVIRGVKAYLMLDPQSYDQPILNATVVVDGNGMVVCVNHSTLCDHETDDKMNFIAQGAWLVPGMIIVDTTTGQSEVDSEPASQDGISNVQNGADIMAVDGILLSNYKNRHLMAAFDGGVTTVVASPQGSQLVSGQTAIFHSIPVVDDVIVSYSASLMVNLGFSVFPRIPSFSSQISTLRALFREVTDPNANYTAIQQPFRDVLDRKIPLSVRVNQVDHINSVVRLKKEFGFDLIIIGGAEAHLIGPKLTQENVSVILSPVRVGPNNFETWNAKDNSPSILHSAGVKVGLSPHFNEEVRTLRWEAGMALQQSWGNLTFGQALAMVTKNIAEMYKVTTPGGGGLGSVAVGSKANFLVFSEDPLTFGGSCLMVAVGNFVKCSPPFDEKK